MWDNGILKVLQEDWFEGDVHGGLREGQSPKAVTDHPIVLATQDLLILPFILFLSLHTTFVCCYNFVKGTL